IEGVKQTLETLLQELSLGVSRENEAQVREVGKVYREYRAQLEATVAAAEAVLAAEGGETADGLRDLAMSSRAAVGRLRDLAQAVSVVLDQNVARVSKEAEARHAEISAVMTTVAAAGIGAAMLLAVLIAHFGIARPIRSVVDVLQRLASG